MIGVLPIINRKGEPAATFQWKGTMWNGQGTWKWFASKDVQTQVETAIKVHEDLRLTDFSDMVMDANWVKGWQGFAGWFQALGIALPAYGLMIDSDNIVWPFKQIGEPDQDFDPEGAQGAGNGIS